MAVNHPKNTNLEEAMAHTLEDYDHAFEPEDREIPDPSLISNTTINGHLTSPRLEQEFDGCGRHHKKVMTQLEIFLMEERMQWFRHKPKLTPREQQDWEERESQLLRDWERQRRERAGREGEDVVEAAAPSARSGTKSARPASGEGVKDLSKEEIAELQMRMQQMLREAELANAKREEAEAALSVQIKEVADIEQREQARHQEEEKFLLEQITSLQRTHESTRKRLEETESSKEVDAREQAERIQRLEEKLQAEQLARERLEAEMRAKSEERERREDGDRGVRLPHIPTDSRATAPQEEEVDAETLRRRAEEDRLARIRQEVEDRKKRAEVQRTLRERERQEALLRSEFQREQARLTEEHERLLREEEERIRREVERKRREDEEAAARKFRAAEREQSDALAAMHNDEYSKRMANQLMTTSPHRPEPPAGSHSGYSRPAHQHSATAHSSPRMLYPENPHQLIRLSTGRWDTMGQGLEGGQPPGPTDLTSHLYQAFGATRVPLGRVVQLKHVFQRADKEGTGKLTFKNLGDWLNSNGQDPSASQVETMIKHADMDGDGQVDFWEFLAMQLYRWRGLGLQELTPSSKPFSHFICQSWETHRPVANHYPLYLPMM